jgi:prepilin-type N-terminal cleavage/methylation domain-containing protein
MLNRVSDERGFTIPELLITLLIASAITMAAFGLVDTVMHRTGETAARVESVQSARGAMDDMTRELRSQVCVTRSDPSLMTTPRSVYAATATSITFFADTADESWRTGVTTMPVSTLRTLAYDGGSKLTETIVPGINDTVNVGAVTFGYSGAATATKNRVLLTQIKPQTTKVGSTVTVTPIFRYYAFDTTKSPPTPTLPLDPGTGSLNETQLQSIAKISLNFQVNPPNLKVTGGGWTVLQDDVFVRTADPNTAAPKPTCA